MTQLAERLSFVAGETEGRLTALLHKEAARGAPPRLVSALRHAVLSGGKRFRPFLVVEAAGLFGVPHAKALDAAAAIECIHCYSLAHDDLPDMDNDVLRRGQPTVWKAFDTWTAILAGDALQSLAFEVLTSEDCHPDGRVRCALAAVLAKASGAAGMVGGQALDLEAERLRTDWTGNAAQVSRMQAMKTGALIAAACEMGAILGGATPAERADLVAYGRALGAAFQISDDLLDAEGGAETVGKATGKDAAAGKATLVSLRGLDTARSDLKATVAEAIASLARFADRGDILAEAARLMLHREA